MTTATASPESARIKRLEALHYHVHDLARSRRFYLDKLDFREVGVSSDELNAHAQQRSAVFEAEQCRVIVSEPIGPNCRASRFLARHPDGVATLIFEVEDLDHTFAFVSSRGATLTTDIVTHATADGTLRHFTITTPFGDTLFRFVERKGITPVFPGFSPHATHVGGTNRFGFTHFDHITSNFLTMAPALLWMQHVMGFERFWDVEFHTTDVSGPADKGSGLKSTVMWDPHSGCKFANNEPARPFFRASQIAIFVDDHRGDGVQHAALAVRDILTAVRTLKGTGVEFMPTPGTYYDMLPERIRKLNIGRIDEDHNVLRELEILVDGEGPGSYLLQIFLKDSAGLYREPAAGPFFYEIIQRKGDQGFGAGNFRALFESIERQQMAEGRL